jgi:hypothetical protein
MIPIKSIVFNYHCFTLILETTRGNKRWDLGDDIQLIRPQILPLPL